jgi:RNA polymerase sigma-70 factor (ECF subfamily)
MDHARKGGALSVEGVPSGARSFEEHFRSEYPGLYRLVFRVLGTREEAEDVVQEAFLRLHGRLSAGAPIAADLEDPGLVGGAPIRPWLYRVAINLALNARRNRRRLWERHRRSWIEGPGDVAPDPDPHDAAERAQDRLRVREVLSRMPERQAKLLLLRHAGLPYREIAAALEIAPGSVGTLLARAEEAFEVTYERRFR